MVAIPQAAMLDPNTITWSASGSPSALLEEVGVVTQYEFTARVTPSATLGGANQPDGLYRLFNNFEIQGNQSYFSLPSGDAGGHAGTIWKYRNIADGYGLGHPDSVITAPKLTHTPVKFMLHCGPMRPWDPFDLSGIIPADHESLRATWTTTPNSVMDDSITISSAVMSIHASRWTYDSPADLRAAAQAQGVPMSNAGWPSIVSGPSAGQKAFMVPAHRGRVIAMDGTYAGNGRRDNMSMAVGAFCKRIAILMQDATGTRPVRSSDELTEIIIEDDENRYQMLRCNTEALAYNLPASAFLTVDGAAGIEAATPAGIYMFDFSDLAMPGQHDYPVKKLFGPDWRLRTQGSLVTRTTIATYASGDDMLRYYERYVPTDLL